MSLTPYEGRRSIRAVRANPDGFATEPAPRTPGLRDEHGTPFDAEHRDMNELGNTIGRGQLST
jgi:hypothetical protein